MLRVASLPCGGLQAIVSIHGCVPVTPNGYVHGLGHCNRCVLSAVCQCKNNLPGLFMSHKKLLHTCLQAVLQVHAKCVMIKHLATKSSAWQVLVQHIPAAVPGKCWCSKAQRHVSLNGMHAGTWAPRHEGTQNSQGHLALPHVGTLGVSFQSIRYLAAYIHSFMLHL